MVVAFYCELEMKLIFSLILSFACIRYGHCERHHLQFLFTALTKPDGFFGPVFSAVCVCDDRQISRYSNEQEPWKRHSLDAEIWRGADVPDVSRDWFLHQINTLTNCTSSRCDGLHTLQRRIGCEVDKGGSVMIVNAFDEYRYDGEDFIAFNFSIMQWKDKRPNAKETLMKWDTDRFHNQDLQSYLNKCMDWISTFNASISTPPALYMFTSAAPHDQSKLILTCLATGFYPKHIEMNITLNNITLQLFSSTGVRPNDNQTFQMRNSVEINREEKQSYECHVLHSGQTFTKSWADGSLKSRRHHWVAAVDVMFAVLCTISLIYKYRRLNDKHKCSLLSENIIPLCHQISLMQVTHMRAVNANTPVQMIQVSSPHIQELQ